MKTIYLLLHNTGDYDNSYTKTVRAYFDKETRDNEIKRLNDIHDYFESHRDLWNNIADYLEGIEHPEYDKFWDEYQHPMPVPEEYENYLFNDSFERFVYWMTKEMNDTFSKHDIKFWEDMYDYYVTNYGQYGPDGPGHYSGSECELYE